jgi:hypothetical protein
MSASNPYLQRALRFCDLCGQFLGNLSRHEWDQAAHLCKDCEESRSESRMIFMPGILQMRQTSDQPR